MAVSNDLIQPGTTSAIPESAPAYPPDPPECGSVSTAIEAIRRLFVDRVQFGHITGTSGEPNNQPVVPAPRAAFIKQQGGVYATFQVADDLPEEYRVGIFQRGAHYTAWLRFSSDIPSYNPDHTATNNGTTGVGIKLFGVAGPKVLDVDPGDNTLDLILQNTTSFFASDAMEMCGFKMAAYYGYIGAWRKDHPVTDGILKSMAAREVKSLLTEKLWSCIPYKFGTDADGQDRYCKYVLQPRLSDNGITPDDADPNYLMKDLQARLKTDGAIFDFQIQLRTNVETQSIINASDIWNEGVPATDDHNKNQTTDVSKPVTVATIYIPPQDISARGQSEYSESLSFSIARTLPEMAPVGSIAEARVAVYLSSAKMRRDVNGQTIGEPSEPRTPAPPSPPYAVGSSWPAAGQG
ncbi:hypothetical protein [Bordetella sp. N]|uniref:hypothetical protein n=1 Tax=Bordetella sp. N TaxID=1746199 RepID=UPI00070BF763|nr:hypothetical protein [Bordetella sp. N]ALM84798.1 hypothetical protein ASB57_19095 [Bordetella sp. N]